MIIDLQSHPQLGTQGDSAERRKEEQLSIGGTSYVQRDAVTANFLIFPFSISILLSQIR